MLLYLNILITNDKICKCETILFLKISIQYYITFNFNISNWLVLWSTEAYSAFKNFLQKEFSVENILFWSAVEKYKAIDLLEKRKETADFIFENFLMADAQYEVSFIL